MAELTGQPVPQQVDGISFVATLRGDSAGQKQHAYLYWEHPQTPKRDQAVRMAQWKGVLRGWKTQGPTQLELYDVSKDLGERNDVAAEHPDIVKKITQIMQEAHRDP